MLWDTSKNLIDKVPNGEKLTRKLATLHSPGFPTVLVQIGRVFVISAPDPALSTFDMSAVSLPSSDWQCQTEWKEIIRIWVVDMISTKQTCR